MKITSTSFGSGESIPVRYTGAGDDVSPQLGWSDVPAGTKTFAVICDDPDAPSQQNRRPEGPWVHWVIYNIPVEVTSLPEAVERVAAPSCVEGASQGTNDFDSDNTGYRGPMPPVGSGPHHYFFKVYALNDRLDLAAADATKQSLLNAIRPHLLATGQLMGTFERFA